MTQDEREEEEYYENIMEYKEECKKMWQDAQGKSKEECRRMWPQAVDEWKAKRKAAGKFCSKPCELLLSVRG